MNRDAVEDLRVDLAELARMLDLFLLRAKSAETEPNYVADVKCAVLYGHAIADRLEAFASPELPAIGGDS